MDPWHHSYPEEALVKESDKIHTHIIQGKPYDTFYSFAILSL
jgi:hypothetical protein